VCLDIDLISFDSFSLMGVIKTFCLQKNKISPRQKMNYIYRLNVVTDGNGNSMYWRSDPSRSINHVIFLIKEGEKNE